MGRLGITLESSFEKDAQSEGEWDRLLVGSHQNSIFMSEGWLKAWSETVGAGENLIIARVREDGVLAAAAAFQEKDGIISFAGNGPSDYSDFILSTTLAGPTAAAALELLLKSVRDRSRRFNHFFLGRMATESSTFALLGKGSNGFHSTICRGTAAPSMDMAAADEKLKKKSLRRHERTLEREGKLSDQTYTRAADILPFLDAFFEQHVSRWQHTPTPSMFLDPVYREFYRRFVHYLDSSGWLRFTVLKLDDRLIAAHCGFLSGDRFTWYKPTFDVRMQKLSPGEVLIKRLIERAKAENAAEFDFTIGDEDFKYRFATKIRQVVYAHVTDSWTSAAIRRARVYLGKKWPRGKSSGENKKKCLFDRAIPTRL